jgi:hypothetical protein
VQSSRKPTKLRRSYETRLAPKMFSTKRVFLLFVVAIAVALVLFKGSGARLSAAGHALPLAAQDSPAAKMCEFSPPGASFSVPHLAHAPELNTDPQSATWAHAASTWITKDCTHQVDYPQLKTEVRGFWTDSDLYLLFISPYKELNLWLPADNSKDRLNLWDRDVVEFFLGDDWTNIRHYREFEIAPTGDWVDLAIDLDRDSYGAEWNSGWQRQGRIDEKNHLWYGAARVPLSSVSDLRVKEGTKWRLNLYRIDGLGPDSGRHFMCWQETCVVNRDPNHVPEHFGTLIFEK